MPRRSRVNRRRPRRSLTQNVVISVYAALSQGNHQIMNLDSGPTFQHRDFRPLFISVQLTGSLGSAVTFQLLGHDSDTVRDFGPFIVGSTIQRLLFRWPRNTDWFPARDKGTIARVKILPCAGACPANQTAYVRIRCHCLTSDYDSGFTNVHHVSFESPTTPPTEDFEKISLIDSPPCEPHVH